MSFIAIFSLYIKNVLPLEKIIMAETYLKEGSPHTFSCDI